MKAVEATSAECRLLNLLSSMSGHGLRIGNSVDAHELLDGLLTTAALVVDTTGAETVGRFGVERAVRRVCR